MKKKRFRAAAAQTLARLGDIEHNIELAFDRLADVISRAIRRPKKRHATKPTRGSKRRRLEGKRIHGEKKRQRGGSFE